jgi:hypothetical protein
MTNLGIRRWLTIRRWPPVAFATVFIGVVTEPLHSPRWEQDLVAWALGGAVIVTALATDAYLSRRALRLVGVRSRPTYLAMGTSLLALAAGCFTGVALNEHSGVLPNVVILVGLLASWAGLLALGRALTWGRLRRLCWVYPPAGRRIRSNQQADQ